MVAEKQKNQNETFSRQSVVLDYAKLAELIVKDLNKRDSQRLQSYKKEDISRWLSNPMQYSKNLQGMSNFLYHASPHYRRLVNYYAKMTTLDYFLEPYGLDLSKKINVKSLRNSYQKAVDLVELMNIKHEFGKALVSAWKLGTFYGYEHYTNDSYFIQELPYEFCQIDGIIDGVFTFSFDTTYFDKFPNQLELYPKEFQKMYKAYKNGTKPRWQNVDPSRTVCIKINEEFYYDFPPFAGVFADIFDIADYKSLRLANTVIGNYKFIVEKIPMRNNSDKNNDFLVDLKTVAMFHNKTANLLPEEIGIFSTPFEIDTIEFSKDTSDKDRVQEAERDFYSASGTSQLLFNGSSSSQANLSKSITVDESEVFLLHRQIERIVNLKIKNEVKGNFKFRLRILDNTIFNRKENTENLLKNAQFGLPVKSMLCASLGLSPSATLSLAYFENEVLGLTDMFIPLSSSHTQSSKDLTNEGGRPPKSEDELSEKGEETRNRGDNENRE
jgi:hypothetical protein